MKYIRVLYLKYVPYMYVSNISRLMQRDRHTGKYDKKCMSTKFQFQQREQLEVKCVTDTQT